MSKTSIHFNSQAECDAYFADYLPTYPSKYLIIIDSVDADSSGEVKMENVLITSTNNYNKPGSTAAVTMGTSAVETAQEKTSDNDEALTLSEYTLEGEGEEENTNISEE